MNSSGVITRCVIVGLDTNRAMHIEPIARGGEPALASIEIGVRIGLRFRWLGEEGPSR
jgi:hypothetical protein